MVAVERQQIGPGSRFGRLVVIELVEGWRAVCRCDCGKSTRPRRSNLLSGITRSCGCYAADMHSERLTKHGHARSRARPTGEYNSWANMIARCTVAHHRQWPDYGGRGITVCKRWRESFDTFLEDMGRKPSSKHSIDRIDNDGHYEPGNCRWADAFTQAGNRRPRRRKAK